MSAIWTPQPGPQADAISADWCPIVLYGGAKFGGKTDFGLGDYLQDLERYNKHWQGIIFRRSLTEFTEIKLRAHELFPKAGGIWKEQKHEWHFPNYGDADTHAIVRFRYLESLDEVSKYEGHSYPWMLIDEVGDWEDGTKFFRLLASNRYGRANIPTIRFRLTCNPGGRGHAWLKQYFVDPAPLGYVPVWDEALKLYRMLIPAKLEDNVIGRQNDPNYEHRMMRLGSAALVRALRHGDWNVVAGAYFARFSARNILRPFDIPEHWQRFVAYDPGYSDPFALTWWAVSDGQRVGDTKLPKGAIVCYREWIGERDTFQPGEIRGLQLGIEETAERIHHLEGRYAEDGSFDARRGEQIAYRVAGHDLWENKRGISDFELFAKYGIYFQRAEIARKPGWRLMDQEIAGHVLDGDTEPTPMMYWLSSCPKCIEYIPLMQHDKKDAEDVEESPNDHAPDSCRYAKKSRSSPVELQKSSGDAVRKGTVKLKQYVELKRRALDERRI